MTETDHQPQRVWSPAIAHTVTSRIIVVVMGVSGSGKSTVAALLAAALGCQFQEGDDLHPPENVEKMRSGTPLTDADRMPWLRKDRKSTRLNSSHSGESRMPSSA